MAKYNIIFNHEGNIRVRRAAVPWLKKIKFDFLFVRSTLVGFAFTNFSEENLFKMVAE